ncbi:unnamed protein product [Rotaria sordida]|uniref:Uncharacterized protein n=1 Tax=Rotaria sordida TaxID=392033 RepID=A0A816EDZ3_9BILA|nr:unnamed protein product [Rotaria sordida]CAF1646556.1 unnamed protein product [Rotaria sordida]
MVAEPHHAIMNKGWKYDIGNRRDKARTYLISGEDSLEIQDAKTQIEVLTAEIPRSPFKAQAATVPPVIATTAVVFPIKMDIVKNFTLNSQQKCAFTIVTNHLDGDN